MLPFKMLPQLDGIDAQLQAHLEHTAHPARAGLQHPGTDEALGCPNPSGTRGEDRKLPLLHSCRVVSCCFAFAVEAAGDDAPKSVPSCDTSRKAAKIFQIY